MVPQGLVHLLTGHPEVPGPETSLEEARSRRGTGDGEEHCGLPVAVGTAPGAVRTVALSGFPVGLSPGAHRASCSFAHPIGLSPFPVTLHPPADLFPRSSTCAHHPPQAPPFICPRVCPDGEGSCRPLCQVLCKRRGPGLALEGPRTRVGGRGLTGGC